MKSKIFSKITTREIAALSVLISLSIIIGIFINFPLLGGKVYLVGIGVFLMPIFFRLYLSILGVAITILITDLATGYIAFTWISLLAYLPSTVLIRFSFKAKFKFIYIIDLLLSSLIAIVIYYLCESLVFSHSLAIDDVIATSIQFAIVVPITTGLYYPLKKLIYKENRLWMN